MLRELTTHKVNKLNRALTIKVLDEPKLCGANYLYQISVLLENSKSLEVGCLIKFHEFHDVNIGVNGITNVALLAIVEDRLKGFQSGEFDCRENAIALTKLQEVIMWLQKNERTMLNERHND